MPARHRNVSAWYQIFQMCNLEGSIVQRQIFHAAPDFLLCNMENRWVGKAQGVAKLIARWCCFDRLHSTALW